MQAKRNQVSSVWRNTEKLLVSAVFLQHKALSRGKIDNGTIGEPCLNIKDKVNITVQFIADFCCYYPT